MTHPAMNRSVRCSLLGAVVLCLALTGPTSAESLKDRLGDGLSKIKEGAGTIAEGAKDVADTVTDTVTESVDSAEELFTDEATPEETRARLDAMAVDTMQRLFEEQPEALDVFDRSAGYAVFDTRKVTLLGVTGGGGRGVAVAPDGWRIYMRMGTAGVGVALGIGGFESQVVFFFETEDDFRDFVTTGLDATAEAGTMVDEEKEGLRVRFENGRAMYLLTTRGWRVAASAAGTKYWPDPNLN